MHVALLENGKKTVTLEVWLTVSIKEKKQSKLSFCSKLFQYLVGIP